MLAYCDFIASVIKKAVVSTIQNPFSEVQLTSVHGPKYDLDPVDGYMLTTKKTMEVTDGNGKRYKITIEEI